jgi:hypothetical protein
MLNGNSMSLGKRFGWLAAILLAGAGCAAQVGGPEGSVGEDQAALTAPAPMVPVTQGVPQVAVPVPGLTPPKPGATRAPVDPGASETGGDNGEPQPNPWHGGSSADDGDSREPQPNPWLGRKGMDDGDGNEPQPNPWNPVKMPGPVP